MHNCTIERKVGTQYQPLDDTIWPDGVRWGTSNRPPVEQGSVDARCRGPVGKSKPESWGMLTLQGKQWLAGAMPISADDLGYYLGEYADPSASQMDGDTEK